MIKFSVSKHSLVIYHVSRAVILVSFICGEFEPAREEALEYSLNLNISFLINLRLLRWSVSLF